MSFWWRKRHKGQRSTVHRHSSSTVDASPQQGSTLLSAHSFTFKCWSAHQLSVCEYCTHCNSVPTLRLASCLQCYVDFYKCRINIYNVYIYQTNVHFACTICNVKLFTYFCSAHLLDIVVIVMQMQCGTAVQDFSYICEIVSFHLFLTTTFVITVPAVPFTTTTVSRKCACMQNQFGLLYQYYSKIFMALLF